MNDTNSDRNAAGTRGIRVLVVLRSEVMRWGLAAMLRSITNVGNVVTCRDCEEAGGLASASRPDVLVANLADARTGGLPMLVADTRREHTKVLLLVRDSGVEAFSAAAQLQGDGYLVEEELTVPVLDDTLRRLLVDQVPMPAAMARALLHRAGRPKQAEPARVVFSGRLTRREQQALALLVEGMSNKQIGRRLAISDHAVKRVMASMLVKLNCANRTQVVALALRGGLVGARTT